MPQPIRCWKIFVETSMTEGRGSGHRAQVADECLLKRVAQPEEIAEGIAYLCAGAAFVTGQVPRIDGGRGY